MIVNTGCEPEYANGYLFPTFRKNIFKDSIFPDIFAKNIFLKNLKMKKIRLFIFSLMFLPFFVQAQEEARLLRFPAIQGDQVVFTYAGDIYTVARSGGMARKLTNHEGFEMFGRFSPDGRQIAFTAQYDGNTEVYVMPSEGGVPKRLTYTATLGRDDISDRMGPIISS